MEEKLSSALGSTECNARTAAFHPTRCVIRRSPNKSARLDAATLAELPQAFFYPVAQVRRANTLRDFQIEPTRWAAPVVGTCAPMQAAGTRRERISVPPRT